MAQIRLEDIERIEKARNVLHEKVYTTYTSFEKDGQKYFQLDTYGTSKREIPEKVSQSLQLDETSARFLVKLLIEEFGLL